MSNTKLLRQQLAKFAPDPRTLRALEQALETTQIVTPDYVSELSIAAATAESTAVQALGQIEEAVQALSVLDGVQAMAIQSLGQIQEAAQAIGLLASAQATAAQAVGQIQEATQALSLQAGIAENRATQALQQLAGVAQDAAITAGAAETKAQTALARLKDIQESVALLEQAQPVIPPKRKRYGTFYDTTTQTAAAANTAYGMTFNTTEITNGVYIGATTSRIYVDEDGIYNIQFSAQVQNTSGGTHSIWIWLRINGSDKDSATKIRIVGNNTEAVAAWNFVYQLNAGDYFELMWAVDDTSVQLLYQPAAAPVPLLPSIILTVCDNIS